MKQPDVTIVIPTRDRPGLLVNAVVSALRQEDVAVEVIVVDDGSTEPVRIDLDGVRVLRNQRSLGTSASRNVGLAAATGRFVAFLDDDDVLLPHMAKTSIRAESESPLPRPVVVLSAMEVVDPKGKTLEVRVPSSHPRGGTYFLDPPASGTNIKACNALMASRNLLLTVGGWDERISGAEHDDLLLRLNQVASIVGVPTITYRMNSHPGTRGHQDLASFASGMERVLRKHRKSFIRNRHRHGHYMGTTGVYYLRAGQWNAAIAASTKAVLIDPSQLRLYVWWLAALAGPRALRSLDGIRRPARRRFQSEPPRVS